MKKIFLLSCLAMLLFSCTKEKAPITPDQPEHVKVIKPFTLNPGSGATIAYDAASGLYKANYGGAELVFSPIPQNTNYADGDVVNTSVSCTNCTYFEPAANGYFVASVPTLPLSTKESLHTLLTNYSQAFSDYINGVKIPTDTTQYKQPTLPNFPSVSSTYSGTVSGVVVRSHSSPSTCMVLPSTYAPNPVPRNAPPGTPAFVGYLASQLHPFIVFELQGNGATGSPSGVITSVTLHFAPDPAITVTWSGSYTRVTDTYGTHYFVTVDIYHDNVLYEHFQHVEASMNIL